MAWWLVLSFHNTSAHHRHMPNAMPHPLHCTQFHSSIVTRSWLASQRHTCSRLISLHQRRDSLGICLILGTAQLSGMILRSAMASLVACWEDRLSRWATIAWHRLTRLPCQGKTLLGQVKLGGPSSCFASSFLALFCARLELNGIAKCFQALD